MKGIVITLIGLVMGISSRAGIVDTLSVYSTSMKKEIKCVIIKPDHFRNGETLPVAYLLHGWSGNYAQWTRIAPQLAKKADELNMLLVCPDGGFDSWYFNSPIDSAVRYETFITKELVSYIDQHYKTIAHPRFRAITGLSMGGHGAFYLAFRHKDVFGVAGSMSGGVDIRPFPNNWGIGKKLGDTSCCKNNWEQNTVINIADQLRPDELEIIFDCGVDDFFFTVNRALHQKLLEKKISHDYTERPGGHNNEYWSNSIDYHLLFFRKSFNKAIGSVRITKGRE